MVSKKCILFILWLVALCILELRPKFQMLWKNCWHNISNKNLNWYKWIENKVFKKVLYNDRSAFRSEYIKRSLTSLKYYLWGCVGVRNEQNDLYFITFYQNDIIFWVSLKKNLKNWTNHFFWDTSFFRFYTKEIW